MSYLEYLIKNKDKIKKGDEDNLSLLQSLKNKSIIEERRKRKQEKIQSKIPPPPPPMIKKSSTESNETDKPKIDAPKKKKVSKQKRYETREEVHHIITKLIKKYYDESELLKADVNKIFHDVKEDIDILPKPRAKPKKKIEYTDELFNNQEISKILSKAEELGDAQSLASTLFFKFGLKLYEIAKLKIEDVDVMRKVIKVDNKNVKVDDDTFKKIVNYMSGKNSGNLLGGGSGKKFERQDLLDMIKSIMSSAKVKQRKNIESAIENFRKSLNAQGKAYNYWDHIDQVIEIRNKEVEQFKTQ